MSRGTWSLSAAANGLLGSLNLPARQSLFPQLVGPSLVANALALLGLSFNAARVIGPGLAGLLIAGVGLGGSFVLLTVVQTLATLSLLFMSGEPGRDASAREHSVGRNFLDALGYAWKDAPIRWLLLLAAAQNTFGVVFIYLLPVFAGRV